MNIYATTLSTQQLCFRNATHENIQRHAGDVLLIKVTSKVDQHNFQAANI